MRKVTKLAPVLFLMSLAGLAHAADQEFLSAPFPADANVDLVQGWFYFWNTVTANRCDSNHQGMDFATLNESGSTASWESFPVLAAAPGWAWTEYHSGYGNIVVIRHVIRNDGELEEFFTFYAHLDSLAAKVNLAQNGTGVRVQRGEYLGTAGNTGNDAGTAIHLHFELRTRNTSLCAYRIDPYDLYSNTTSNTNTGSYASTVDNTSGMGNDSFWVSDPPHAALDEDYLDLAAVDVDDDQITSNGNGDGVPDPGEQVELNAWIRSPGSYSYLTPFGQLYESNTHATKIDSREDYDSVQSVGVEKSAFDYDIDFSSTTPTGSDFEFYVKLWEGGSTGTFVNRSAYSIAVGEQEFQGLASPMLLIDDDQLTSNGNGNGVVEPGEKVELIVYLQNYSTDTISDRDLRCTLHESSPFVTVSDSTETWPELKPGRIGHTKADYDLTVSASAPDNEVIEIRLECTNQGQFLQNVYISVNIGM